MLIANVRQDILAKVTRTLSLLSADTDDSGDDDDELWFEMRLLQGLEASPNLTTYRGQTF